MLEGGGHIMMELLHTLHATLWSQSTDPHWWRKALVEAISKPDSSLDLANLLSRCFGYCSHLAQWDCNRCTLTKVLKVQR